MTEKKLNQEIDVTKFVNISDEKFIFHIGGQPREIEAKEEKIMPIYIAKHGAKHLIDKILQSPKYNIKDTLRDTPVRQDLMTQILPDLAEEKGIKPLSDEEFRKKLEEEQQRQAKLIDELSGKAKEKENENKEKIKELEEKIKSLTEEKEEKKSTKKVAKIK